jgi:bifunctional non-homologous end joining protein LigD
MMRDRIKASGLHRDYTAPSKHPSFCQVLEGIIAKRKTSVYRPGKRSPDWLKIKARPQQEFVVRGFTEGRGSRRKHFGALLLGAYQQGKLRYYGHSGSGFSERGLIDAMDRLKPLGVDRSPFVNPSKCWRLAS